MKGNGYGFGNRRLARRAAWLGVDTVAVGTRHEIDEVASRFDGDIVVLTPWRTGLDPVPDDPRVIWTVGRPEDLAALAASGGRPRVLLERMTSMLRHGFDGPGLRAADVTGVRLEGVSVHLPLGTHHLEEVRRSLTDVVAAGLDTHDRVGLPPQRRRAGHARPRVPRLHLPAARRHPPLARRPRGAAAPRDRPRRAPRRAWRRLRLPRPHRPRSGSIVVVSGGTANGIGLEAPTGDPSVRSKLSTVARGGLDAAGKVRSPYVLGGEAVRFAEPPHMQASMLYVPQEMGKHKGGLDAPAIGDELDLRVRFTTTLFDEVVWR